MADQSTPADVGGNSDSGAQDMSWTDSRSVSGAASDATVRASPASSVTGGESLASMIHPLQTPGVGQMQHGPREDTVSQVSGISSMRSGQSQTLPQHLVDTGNRTQEWINNSQFDVFVKALDGKTLTIQTNADETVASLKAKVDEATGVVGSQQRLTTLDGRDLKDQSRLRDHNIGRNSQLKCLGRLRGGYI